jgi:hypothetical protein
MGYCTEADVYRQVPPGALPNPGRLISAVSTSAETLALSGHGLSDDDEVTFRADAGGSLPSPLVAGTTYYAKVVSDALFQVATSAGGAAVNITTAGSNIICVRALPVSEWIEAASAELDQVLPAHVVPVDVDARVDVSLVPRPLREHAAKKAALQGLIYVGGSTLDIERMIQASQSMLDRWARGVPVVGTNAPARGNLAVRSSTTSADPRGWDGPNGRTYLP